jgi:hypothetical protein
MKPTSGWSPELAGLLESFVVLQGLLVRGPSASGANVENSLASLSPQQVGLSSKAFESGDWELFCGGLLYAANALEKAHALFQENHSPEGAYWHGMLHRREGDFSNALYWVRRAGRVPGLAGLNGFSPSGFIADCEAAAARGTEPPDLLELQRCEWEAMLRWSWRRLEATA